MSPEPRDRSRADKQNIVVDLMPEGYQLIKLKDYILDKLSFGTRKEVIAAFWEYVLWLEIAHKLLEKDYSKARFDQSSLDRYETLRKFFSDRVDTGEGDFSERLLLLSNNVIGRFEKSSVDESGNLTMKSSEVLEMIYGNEIHDLRKTVLDYLQIKGYVLFLFDNLDRIWTPGGFGPDDALILVGLAEAMQEMERKFRKRNLDFRWVLFIRSDVYEFLVAGMADYGKLATASLEWSDRDQLRVLFNQRLISSAGNVQLLDISATTVKGQPVMDFLIDSCLMRPRYLIRLFETSRRRALTLKHSKIQVDDYLFGLKELGWQVLEDLDREISDLVNDGSEFLFSLIEHKDDLTPDKVRYLAQTKISKPEDISKLIDLLIWNGSLGVETTTGIKYIFDTGYRRPYLANLISRDSSVRLVLHPTLCETVA